MRRWLAGVVVVAMAIGSRSAAAQRSARFGANLDFGSNSLDFGIGGRVNLDMNEIAQWKNIEGIASFDYFFPGGNTNYWELNANAAYRFSTSNGSVVPYAGAGLNFGHSSGSYSTGVAGGTGSVSSSAVGLNLLGGAQFKAAKRLTPFVEGRLVLRSGSYFVLSGGVYF